MKAILLCAGFGTRLGAATKNHPKALLEVAGRPILDYLVEQLLAMDALGEIHLVSNGRFLARFYEWKERRWRDVLDAQGVAFHLHSNGVTDEDERLGAVGDLAFVLRRTEAPEGAPGGALVTAGDSIYRFPLAPLTQRFLASEGSLVLALYEANRQRLKSQSVLDLDADGRVLGVAHAPEEPASAWTCPACYWLAPAALARVPAYLEASNDRDTLGHFINHLAWHERVEAVSLPERSGLRHHINTRYQLDKANAALAEEPMMRRAGSEG